MRIKQSDKKKKLTEIIARVSKKLLSDKAAGYKVTMHPSVFETNISFRNNLRRMFTENLIAVPTGKRIR
jgi:hypothetical protein